jgi:hypothetical protein
MGFLYDILDAFTYRLVPILRPGFIELSKTIEQEARGGPKAVFKSPNPLGLTPVELRELTEDENSRE